MNETKRPKIRTIDMAYIGMFVALTAICAQISIPLTVPFTMQTFAIFATVAILGLYRGTIAFIVYLLLGAVGVPVFANFKSGVGVLLGTTGGYLIGYLFSVIIIGLCIQFLGKKIWVMALSMVLGLIVCYGVGTLWFMYVYGAANGAVGLVTVLSWCVFPFIIPDLLKIALAIFIERRVGKYVK